jgi:hypothetical protein
MQLISRWPGWTRKAGTTTCIWTAQESRVWLDLWLDSWASGEEQEVSFSSRATGQLRLGPKMKWGRLSSSLAGTEERKHPATGTHTVRASSPSPTSPYFF